MTTLLARIVRRIACVAATAALGAAAGSHAALADAPAAPSAAPAVGYNDAGMHFDAPPGWEKLPVPPADANGSSESDDPPVAVFVHDQGKNDQAVITIKIAPFDGRVDEFVVNRTGDIRKNGDSFVAKNEKIKLGNGMPAYFIKTNSGNEAGHYVETLEYLVCDGTRSIDVAYSGSEGAFDDAKAREAFASLYVVAYPRRRP